MDANRQFSCSCSSFQLSVAMCSESKTYKVPQCLLVIYWLDGSRVLLSHPRGGGGLIQGPTHPEFWHTHRPTNVPPPRGGGGLTPTHPPTHPSPFMGVGQTQELWGSSVTPSASGTKHKQS